MSVLVCPKCSSTEVCKLGAFAALCKNCKTPFEVFATGTGAGEMRDVVGACPREEGCVSPSTRNTTQRCPFRACAAVDEATPVGSPRCPSCGDANTHWVGGDEKARCNSCLLLFNTVSAGAGIGDPGASIKAGNPKDVVASTRIPLWLLSTTAKVAWAAAQFVGVAKYGAWNWRADGARFSVYLSAMERHLEGLKNGEEFDPEDGTRHEGSIMACAAILLDAKAMGKLVDDRPPRLDHRPDIAEGEAIMAKCVERYRHLSPKHWTINDTLPNSESRDASS